LAKSAEAELRTGLELIGKDKKTIRELIACGKKEVSQPFRTIHNW